MSSPRTLHRAAVDHHRSNGLAVFLHHMLDELAVRGIARKAERESKPRRRAESADEELAAAAAGIALDVLKEQRRSFFLEHAPCHGADFAIPIHLGRDPPQRAVLFEACNPLPLIEKTHPAPL